MAQAGALGRAERIPRSGLIQLGASAVLLSSAWPVTKQAIGLGASPLWFAVGRAGLSCVVAFAGLALLGRLRVPTRQDLPTVLAVGILQLGVFFALAHAAAAWIPAGRTAVLGNVTTIWIVPLSVLFLRERIAPRRWAAAGLGVLGVGVLMSPWSIDWTRADVLIGHLFLLGAGLSWSVAILVVRRHPSRASMLSLLPWCFAVATVTLVPVASVLQPDAGHWGAEAFAAVGFIGLVAGPVGTWCLMEVAATLPSVVASVGFLLGPASGLLLSAWWLGEKLTPDLLAGSALILGGVLVAAWPVAETRGA